MDDTKQTKITFYLITQFLFFILDSCVGVPPCQNQGFMKNNGVCSCVCPEGLTGSDCTELNTSPGTALK